MIAPTEPLTVLDESVEETGWIHIASCHDEDRALCGEDISDHSWTESLLLQEVCGACLDIDDVWPCECGCGCCDGGRS